MNINKQIVFPGTKHLLLIIFSFITFFPFLWMLLNALKTKDEIWQSPPTLFPSDAQWHQFIEAWHSAPYGLYIFNSLFTAICIVILQLISGAMLAYALTQFDFKGKKILFGLVIGTYMLPVAATYVPSYIILSKLDLLDTHTGLIISNMVSVFGIFLLRQSFMQVPKEVIAAAKMDGANNWQILWKIIFPLTKPTFMAFALISFVENYNSYLWPALVLKSEEKILITQGLQQFFSKEGAYGMDWPIIMAASSFAVIPLLVLFFFGQKIFIKGNTDSGVKG